MTRFGETPPRGGHRKPDLQQAVAYATQKSAAKPHRIRTAFLSRGTARRLGLNRNHSLRVWCDCMDTTSGMPWGDENDPRRLGSFDALGVVDSREAGSALNLYRHHLQESESSMTQNRMNATETRTYTWRAVPPGPPVSETAMPQWRENKGNSTEARIRELAEILYPGWALEVKEEIVITTDWKPAGSSLRAPETSQTRPRNEDERPVW